MNSLVSIVIPIYNRADLIKRTLDSVKDQTYRPLEIILVDNNSEDSSLSVCRMFQKETNSEDFKVIVTEENKKGANAARNKGLKLATGKYVSFYDSDDEMLPNRISDIMSAFKEYHSDVVAFSSLMQNEKGEYCSKCIYCETSVVNQILTGSLATQCFVARTELIRKIGGWNETLFRWQDWELGVRIMLSSPHICWLKNNSFDIIHVHSQSITGKDFSSSYYSLLDSIHSVRRLIENSENADKLSMLEALYFRQIQLCAILKYEGRIDLSNHCQADLQNSFCTGYKKFIFNVLAIYISRGGRGAWRIARFFL